ncbi:MAG TPA: sugar transferase [Verrucomicrobiae bacterium]|nr:sugar transferase [Verrucomicrobiae bacterium]
MLDVICILVASPILVPVMAVVSVLIKMGSKGPVLFRQQRIGHLGRRFTCLKFRTMVTDADTTVHEGHCAHLIDSDLPMVKMDSHGDSRVVPFGRQLRATGLDELPQILNVLRGDMSLVGPRPCLPCEYDRHLDWQKERYNSLPGLTGLWQVSGKNSTTFNQMIRLDLQYDRNKSVWLDAFIMLRTIPALIAQVRESRCGNMSKTGVTTTLGVGSPLKPISQPIAYTQPVPSGTPVPIAEPVIVEEESWRSR